MDPEADTHMIADVEVDIMTSREWELQEYADLEPDSGYEDPIDDHISETENDSVLMVNAKLGGMGTCKAFLVRREFLVHSARYNFNWGDYLGDFSADMADCFEDLFSWSAAWEQVCLKNRFFNFMTPDEFGLLGGSITERSVQLREQFLAHHQVNIEGGVSEDDNSDALPMHPLHHAWVIFFEEIVVRKAFRRQGVATALVRAIMMKVMVQAAAAEERFVLALTSPGVMDNEEGFGPRLPGLAVLEQSLNPTEDGKKIFMERLRRIERFWESLGFRRVQSDLGPEHGATPRLAGQSSENPVEPCGWFAWSPGFRNAPELFEKGRTFDPSTFDPKTEVYQPVA